MRATVLLLATAVTFSSPVPTLAQSARSSDPPDASDLPPSSLRTDLRDTERVASGLPAAANTDHGAAPKTEPDPAPSPAWTSLSAEEPRFHSWNPATASPPTPVLEFSHTRYSPAAGIDERMLRHAQNAALLGEENGFTYGFLLLAERATAERIAALEAQGVRLLGRHGPQALKARLPLGRLAEVAGLPFVHWVGYSTREQKLSSAANRLTATEPVVFYVSVFEDDRGPGTRELKIPAGAQSATVIQTGGPAERALEAAGIEVLDYEPGLESFRVRGTLEQIQRILDEDFVLYVEPEPPMRPLMDQGGPLISSDYALDSGFDGSGVIVGVIDSGAETDHGDLDETYLCGWDLTGEANTFQDLCGHGSHVLGTIGGSGDCSGGRLRGIAGGIGSSASTRVLVAKVFSATCGAAGPTATAMDVMASGGCGTPGAAVVNNSWGNSCHTSAPVGTDISSRKADQMVFDHNQVQVFSNGNGRDTDCDGFEDYWGGGSVGSPAAAKNVLSVGASSDAGQFRVGDRAPFSSQGPTGDGRIKPDLSAPGCDDRTLTMPGTENSIFSVDSATSCGYTEKCGTSMAAPHVTGGIATLMQHYSWMQGDPSLVKAYLLARTLLHDDYLGQNRHEYGMGRLELHQAHWNSDTAEGWVGGTVHGPADHDTGWTHDFTVPPGARRLTIVMAWDEAPASAGAPRAVDYDLDLYLDHGADCGTMTNCGDWASLSSVSNVEYILLESPASGTYRLKVHPYDAPLFSDLHVDVSWKIDRGDTTPSGALTVFTHDACLRPGEETTITATCSASSSVASGVWVDIDPPSATALTGMQRAFRDGTVASYGAGDDEITLGNIPYGDSRSVTWTVEGTSEATKRFNVEAWSENWGYRSVNLDITFDQTPPGLPGFVGSSPAAGSWSGDNTVFVQWSASSDALCGLDGYGTLWSNSSVAPVSQAKVFEETQTSATSSPLADGTWYYHLKPVDQAGNWASGQSTFGPFRIDTIDPTTVFGLGSSSHAVGVSSPDTTVEVHWSPATDATSGLDGYSYSWTTSSASVPDTTKEIEQNATALVSPPLPNGSWWFAIRSVDNSGRWDSDIARLGPFVIGTSTSTGSLVVTKQTRPDGQAGTFSFTGAAVGNISDGQQIVRTGLTAGTYTVTESVPANWTLTSIQCSDANSSTNVASRTATYHVETGESVNCVFTNCILDLVLPAGTITGSRFYEACNYIEAGNGVVVGTSGNLDLRATNRVALRAGFRVQTGGRLSVNVTP